MNVQKFCVPLYLTKGIKKKRNYYLNLNNYAQWDRYSRNDLKRMFKEQIKVVVKKLKPVKNPCVVRFTIFYPTKRLFDIDNIGSVVSKFTNDALVELKILEDDNYLFITDIHIKFGGIDKDNPRCNVTIEEQSSG